jgi:hypothetical protein
MHEHTHDEGLTTEDQEYARDREQYGEKTQHNP